MEVKKSVSEFVELLMKSGSLDNRFTTNRRALDGIKAHQKLQKSNEAFYKKYKKEVFIKTDISINDFLLHLEGRCDGIIFENDDVIIEEIKSTYTPLIDISKDYNTLHWAQAKIYGYIFCEENNISDIYIQLSYYNLDNDEVKSFREKFSYEKLSIFVIELVEMYKKYAEFEYTHKNLRNSTINKLKFPFKTYRTGQLELARACFGTIREGKNIFVQAPTGIGKTISTIFPSVKAIGDGIGDKIFYLTAKNINKKVAEDTFELLRKKGVRFRTISLIAKEKICLNDKVSCNADDCLYAKAYYSKLKNVLFDILENSESISREDLELYGEKYKICPFELSLELVNWSDGVICDYNYIFDPKVYLKGMVDEDGKNNIVLIDEAHNLVSRGRAMYSAKLSKSAFMELRREVRGKYTNIYRCVNKINDYFSSEKDNCDIEGKEYIVYSEVPKKLCTLLRSFIKESEEILQMNNKLSFDELLKKVYFDSNTFLSISELYGDDYSTYINCDRNDVEISLFCIDPSNKLRDRMNRFKSNIIFSATLTPFEYFIKIIGGDSDDYRLRLKSPFDKENLKVYFYPGNTRYLSRERTLPSICDKIIEFINKEKGNYILFFPSYEYMIKAKSYLENKIENEDILIQKQDMNDIEKEEFLDKFTDSSNNIALCVIGGMFSEGVDLPGKRLIGAVIVGVGYPKISIEGQLIKSYFKEDGDKIAYIYPGINKVMQAVGRIIRTDTDKGRVLLIDDRYNNYIYSKLIPEEWKPLNMI